MQSDKISKLAFIMDKVTDGLYLIRLYWDEHLEWWHLKIAIFIAAMQGFSFTEDDVEFESNINKLTDLGYEVSDAHKYFGTWKKITWGDSSRKVDDNDC